MTNTIELGIGTVFQIHAKVKKTGFEYDLYYQVDAIRMPEESEQPDIPHTHFREPTGHVSLIQAVSERDGHPTFSGEFPTTGQFNTSGTVNIQAERDDSYIESRSRVIDPNEVPQGLIFMRSQ